MSAEQNGDGGAEDLVFGQRIAFAAGVDHEGEDVVTWGCSARFDSGSQVGPQIKEGLLGLQAFLERRIRALHECHDTRRPFGEERDITQRHPEELRDHMNR